MKKKFAVIGVSALIGLGLLSWQGGWESTAAANPNVVTMSAGLALPATGETPEFVGADKCKKCHLKQHKSWKEGKKFNALETLKPGQAAEAKTKHNLDPAKDYSQDTACLACHTTGFGKAGGYAVPDAADEKAVKDAAKLAGVGCESCHGAGGAYMELHEEIMKSKRKYKVDEMYAGGMTKIEESTCTACHNDKSPTYDAANPFDFAKMKEKGAHEHIPLTQREE